LVVAPVETCALGLSGKPVWFVSLFFRISPLKVGISRAISRASPPRVLSTRSDPPATPAIQIGYADGDCSGIYRSVRENTYNSEYCKSAFDSSRSLATESRRVKHC
jgi:hypothetical protein